VILGNPTIIAAFKAGIPGNGKPFPEGWKLQWKPKKSTEAPFVVDVPDTLADLFFMEKDTKRFPDTGGWGYAQFDYDAASATFSPDKAGTPNCGNVRGAGHVRQLRTSLGRRDRGSSTTAPGEPR